MKGGFIGGALAAASLVAASPAGAQPETPGPLSVQTWVPTTADGAPVPLSPGGVFIPKAPGPFPPVALVHGLGENGGLHTVMATTLASRGVVVLAPTFPDELVNPTTADGDNVNALLDWAVQKSGDPSSPLAGKVDGSTRGVLGHSNGGVVFYAAAHSPLIKAIVSLDGVAFLDQSPGFSGPSLHLLSAHHDCNGGSSVGYTGAPPPKLLGTVVDGDHCDVDNPADPFCPSACGGTAWSSTASQVFHRYAVAWIACILAHDTTVAPWIGGAGMQADVDAGLLSGVEQVDVAAVSCTGLTGGDGGIVQGSDSGTGADAGASGDAGPDGTVDAASGSGAGGSGSGGSSGGAAGDASTGGASSSKSGCSCAETPGAPSPSVAVGLAVAGLVAALGRRRASPPDVYCGVGCAQKPSMHSMPVRDPQQSLSSCTCWSAPSSRAAGVPQTKPPSASSQ